jgi:hypothetical protein
MGLIVRSHRLRAQDVNLAMGLIVGSHRLRARDVNLAMGLIVGWHKLRARDTRPYQSTVVIGFAGYCRKICLTSGRGAYPAPAISKQGFLRY